MRRSLTRRQPADLVQPLPCRLDDDDCTFSSSCRGAARVRGSARTHSCFPGEAEQERADPLRSHFFGEVLAQLELELAGPCQRLDGLHAAVEGTRDDPTSASACLRPRSSSGRPASSASHSFLSPAEPCRTRSSGGGTARSTSASRSYESWEPATAAGTHLISSTSSWGSNEPESGRIVQ